MKKITVLIVDDSALIRAMFTDMLNGEDDITVVGTATDPIDAREKIKRLDPDVVTLDIEMPKMSGLAFLEKIMTLRPMPVIMVSSLTQSGASATLEALELGAVDYVFKFTGGGMEDITDHLRQELVAKVRVAAQAKTHLRKKLTGPQLSPLPFSPPRGRLPVLAFGSSTGGVEALRDIFLALPKNAPPIVITQHMPANFTPSFAARLDKLSQVSVAEAYDGAVLKPGHAWLAPGGVHLKVIKQGKELVCVLEDGPSVSGFCPSVDVLFTSVAECAGTNAIGVILTGMGKDGAWGLKKMRDAGAYTIGQNKDSCIVYGMPRAAAENGAVCCELPLSGIAKHILRYCEGERSRDASFGT